MNNEKQNFVGQFFKHLEKFNYVVLKHLDEKTATESYADIDLLIERKDVPPILAFAADFPTVDKTLTQRSKSMVQTFIHFKNGDFLQLDFLFKLVRKQYEYMTTQEVFENNQKSETGYKTYAPDQLLEHVVLFNSLNYGGVPDKYIQHFSNLPRNEQDELLRNFSNKYDSPINSFQQLAQFNLPLRNNLVKTLKTMPQNSLLNRVKHYGEYAIDKVKGLFDKSGKIITFSGVDGAGKSTIIDLVKNELATKYRKKVVVLRHRPSILPIISAWRYGKAKAEKRTVQNLPHSGNNKSSISSMIRFLYYYFDYLFGQFYVYTKYVLRDYIVLYDRYYFDFIIDGKRSNLNIPTWISKGLYRFIYKPELNFFLFADANVIYNRKKEMPVPMIKDLTEKYCSLFNELNQNSAGKNNYLNIENIEKEKTLNTVIDHCKKII